MPQPLERHLQAQLEKSRNFFWHRVRWHAVSKALPPSAPFSLLDIGAGAGLIGEYLRDERPQGRYHFIEPLESLAARLRERHGQDKDLAKATRYSGMSFITLLDVLEHQENDGEFLEALGRKMDPGAALILTVPALPILWSKWDERLGHFRRYTRSSLSAVLHRSALFDLQTVDYLFPEMVVPGLLRAVRPPQPDQDEFPQLPSLINRGLCAVGLATVALKSKMPLGSSLMAVASRRGAH